MPVTLNMERVAQLHLDARRKGARFWRPDNGANRIRVLPGWSGGEVPCVDLFQHYVGGEEKKFYTCLKTPGIGKFCPICHKVVTLKSHGTEVEEEIANRLRYTKVHLWNVIVRGKEADGIQVFSAPRTIHEPLLAYLLDPDWPTFLDLRRGYDVVVTKSGSGIGTRYNLTVTSQPCLARKDVPDVEKWWEANAVDLTKYLRENIPTAKDLEQALLRMDGGMDEADTAEAQEDELVRRAARPRPAPPVAEPARVPETGLDPSYEEYSEVDEAPTPVSVHAASPAHVQVQAAPVATPTVSTPSVAPTVPVEVVMPTSVGQATATTDKFSALKAKLRTKIQAGV